MLDLTAMVAPDARAAAHYYPAGYWYTLVNVPVPSEFPGLDRRATASRPKWGARRNGCGG